MKVDGPGKKRVSGNGVYRLMAAGLCLFSIQTARADENWPVRLVSRGTSSGQWVVTAENRADFPCTKLRLEATIEGGTLVSGGGQSPARLVDGKLVFQEVASIAPREVFQWTIDFTRASDSQRTTITAVLEYAEKHMLPRKNCANYQPPVGSGMTVSEISFPTGSRQTSALLVHQAMPVEVERNKPYVYQYYVTNISSMTLQNVELIASDFQNLTVSSAEPPYETRGQALHWLLGDLGSCETVVINVTATSSQVGNATACLRATFNNSLCAMTRVVEPALKLVKTAPAEALICDDVEMVLTVSNPGTGFARGVRITDELPDGLTTIDGKSKVEGDAGDLAPGESKKMAFRVKASRTGSFNNKATARSTNNLTAESNSTTTVFRQPVLQLACTAPEERFIGRTAVFTFEVRNTGDAACADTVLRAAVPSGADVVNVAKGGAPGRGEVAWNLGSLAPGATTTVSYEARINQAGNMQTSGTVSCVCGKAVSSTCQTRVVGIPAILLEVIDIDDPVEVGKQTTYVITVTNQGTAPGTNIKVGVDIPAIQNYVSASGPTQATAAGKRVTFGPIPSLAPKQQAEFRLTITATEAGDARLGVEMHSDQFTEPVRETESTNQYR